MHETTYFEGDGTESSPFRISSEDDLIRMRDLVNEGDPISWCYFVQTDDIDLSSTGPSAYADDWEPIGVMRSGHYFYGDYDGSGHTIANVRMASADCGALFGDLRGSIRNLGISSGLISGDTVSGIAYRVEDYASVVNCFNGATISGDRAAAGIVYSNLGKVLHCWNTGAVTCREGHVGGIVYESTGTALGGVSIGVQATPFDDVEHESAPRTYATLKDASEKIGLAYVGLLNYIVSPECGSVDVVIWTDGESPCFLGLWDSSSRFVPLVVRELLATHAQLVLLLIACFVMLVVCVSKYSRARGKSEQEEVPTRTEKLSLSVPKRTYIFRLMSVGLFLALLCAGVIGATRVLLPSQVEAISLREYRNQPKGSVDVLNIGSSRAGCSVDISILWNEYGLATYSMWSSSQTFWDAYYSIVDAIEANQPSLVLLEARALQYENKYLYPGPQLLNLVGVQNPITKISHVRTSLPQNDWLDYIFDLPVYHMRFSEITKEDYSSYEQGVYKGSLPLYGYYSLPEANEGSITLTAKKGSAKEETYLHAIIQLLKSKDIPLTIYAAPSIDYYSCQPFYNRVAQIAAEEGVDFYDCNIENPTVSFSPANYFSDGYHLNTTGAREVSHLIGQHLRSVYSLENHRGNSHYASWDKYQRVFENGYLAEITKLADWFAELKRDGRQLLLVGHWVDGVAYGSFADVAKGVGAGSLVPLASSWRNSEACLWFVDSTSNALNDTVEPLENYSVVLGSHALSYAKSSDGKPMLLDGNKPVLGLGDTSILAVVYDPTTDELVDVVRFEGNLASPNMVREDV